MTETRESIQEWRRETFGEGPSLAALRRAYEEAKEFVQAWEEFLEEEKKPAFIREIPVVLQAAYEELADVLIVCFAHWDSLDLQELIDRKMEKNRERRWRRNGDGTGYHIKEVARSVEGRSEMEVRLTNVTVAIGYMTSTGSFAIKFKIGQDYVLIPIETNSAIAQGLWDLQEVVKKRNAEGEKS